MTTESHTCVHTDTAQWRSDHYEELLSLAQQLSFGHIAVPPSCEAIPGGSTPQVRDWFTDFLRPPDIDDPVLAAAAAAINFGSYDDMSMEAAIYGLQLSFFVRSQRALFAGYARSNPDRYRQLNAINLRGDLAKVDLLAAAPQPCEVRVNKESSHTLYADLLVNIDHLMDHCDAKPSMCMVDPSVTTIFLTRNIWSPLHPQFVPVFYAMLTDALWWAVMDL